MISGFFGLPGVGKTSFLAKIAFLENRRIRRGKSSYTKVYTNFWCDGCFRFNFRDLGRYDISNALILIDEISLEADSRDFKSFSAQLKQFFVLHRHYNCDIVYFTQQYDGLDKKIRDLTFDLWAVKKLGPWTMARRIYRTLDINDDSHEIVQGYRFPNFFESVLSFLFPYLFHVRHWCFRPRYYKYFDSWDRVNLPPYNSSLWTRPDASGGDS